MGCAMELIAEGLACRRAGRLVFEGVSLCVGAGEAAVLRGPNGSGKSSLLRVLGGLIPPAAGTATLGDRPISDGEAWRERVALAGHQDAVKPALTVRENLAGWAEMFGRPGRVEEALARFGLDALAEDPAGWCSAGQRRRLGLARLLVVDRPLWLLDEPTVSLDAASAEVFAGVVKAHCAAGGLAVAATHVALGFDGPEIRLEARRAGPPDAAAAAGGAAATDPFIGEDWA